MKKKKKRLLFWTPTPLIDFPGPPHDEIKDFFYKVKNKIVSSNTSKMNIFLHGIAPAQETLCLN